MVKEVQELTHARMEPCVASCPGLFTARDRKGGKLDITYALGDVSLQFKAADRLTPADQMVLVALVALTGPARQEPGRPDLALMDALLCEPAAAAAGTIVVKTTRARVLSECGGRDGGSTREALIGSLIRLAGLLAIVSRGAQKVSMHLLSFAIDETTGELSVALSPRLTHAILGGRHVRLELHELRTLGEHARLLYTRLCSWIDPGRVRKIGIDALVEYLWPEQGKKEWETRDRRRIVRRAVAEFRELAGWRVSLDARGAQYTISRPPVISPTRAVISPTRAVISPTPESAISA